MAALAALGVAMTRYPHLQDLAALVGQEVAVSEWIAVDQPRIDLFAQATGDHQWIHVDPARAAAGPFGTTIAHGFLTLSLIPALGDDALAIDDVVMGVNYGLNRVRFTAPVKVDSRLRGRFTLQAFDAIAGGAQLTMTVTIEIEGSDRPACVAESVSRRFVAAAP
jgi:acyl dehydratase